MTTENTGASTSGREFFASQQLLSDSNIALLHTDILLNNPTTTNDIHERTTLDEHTIHQNIDQLQEIGVVSNTATENSPEWTATTIEALWSGKDKLYVTPILIATFGATGVDQDLQTYLTRHGMPSIPPAIEATAEYLRGNKTRRMATSTLNVDAVEGIAITQAIERVFATVHTIEPYYGQQFEVDFHQSTIDESPYTID